MSEITNVDDEEIQRFTFVEFHSSMLHDASCQRRTCVCVCARAFVSEGEEMNE